MNLPFSSLLKKTYSVIFPTGDSIDVDAPYRRGRKSANDFLGYNELSLYTNKAIAKRAEKVGEVEFVLRRGETVIEEHPVLTLLNRPNKFFTGRDFWKLCQKHLDITGTAYIYHPKTRELFAGSEPKELHLLLPNRVTPVLSKNGVEFERFDYNTGNGNIIAYPADEVLYLFNSDPADPLKGESLLRSGIRAIDTELQLSAYHARVLKNGGRVDGVFNFKTALNGTQLKELKDSYQDQYGEAQKAGRPLFLGGDASYQRVSLSPDELSFLETKKLTLDDICLMTGVPRAILSQTSGETFTNADAAIGIFLRETVKPLLRTLVAGLDWGLVPPDLDLDFVDPTPEDIDRKVKVVTAAHAVNAATINEKREMLGLDPYPDKAADDIFIPFSVIPLGQEPEPKEPAKEDEEEKRKGFAHPLSDPHIRSKYAQIVEKRLDIREAKLRSIMEGYFEGQRNRLLEHVGQTRTYRRKDLFGEAFDLEAEISLAKGAILPAIELFLRDAGVDAIDLLGSAYEFNLTSDVRSWLDNRAGIFARTINETTFRQLSEQFEESFSAGEDRQHLVRRIQDTYAGYSDTRSALIARTEVHGAVQKGTYEGYRQVGAPIKIWVTVGDAHVRDSHAGIDGEEVPFNQVFSNGLMYPGDERGSAEDVINCRCSI